MTIENSGHPLGLNGTCTGGSGARNQIGAEVGDTAQAVLNLNCSTLRTLSGKTGGGTTISFSDFYGKSSYSPQIRVQTGTVGCGSFTVPSGTPSGTTYHWVIVGGGGSGGTAATSEGLYCCCACGIVGGGGGGGGQVRYGTFTVNSGQTITWNIGAGGAATCSVYGNSGSHTILKHCGSQVASACGGGGAYACSGGNSTTPCNIVTYGGYKACRTQNYLAGNGGASGSQNGHTKSCTRFSSVTYAGFWYKGGNGGSSVQVTLGPYYIYLGGGGGGGGGGLNSSGTQICGYFACAAGLGNNGSGSGGGSPGYGLLMYKPIFNSKSGGGATFLAGVGGTGGGGGGAVYVWNNYYDPGTGIGITGLYGGNGGSGGVYIYG